MLLLVLPKSYSNCVRLSPQAAEFFSDPLESVVWLCPVLPFNDICGIQPLRASSICAWPIPNCAACWLIYGSRSIAKRILSFKVVVETGAIPTCPLLAQAVFMAIENSAIAAVYRSNIEILNIVILSP